MDWLALPETPFLLDSVRPDLMMLRVISRGLIAWSDIVPTEAWVKAQVPSYVPECVYKALGTLPVATMKKVNQVGGEGKENIDQLAEEPMDEGSDLGEEIGDGSNALDLQLLS